ncbi:hypothetical protein [Phormidium sp. CCY1219]|uniref:hypothetical protein n=1 Tax=Phormidium sp. CCY1219 TaxID=2886104 RepID=UPI002D1F1B31|nr:hypothetical protein [Phormidium sp. CCY1219]MEB3827560.1 hypothetical protein [Phormidium sp. CCY1219]
MKTGVNYQQSRTPVGVGVPWGRFGLKSGKVNKVVQMTWILSILRATFLLFALGATGYLSWVIVFYALILAGTIHPAIILLLIPLPILILFFIVAYSWQFLEILRGKVGEKSGRVGNKWKLQPVCYREGINAIIVALVGLAIACGLTFPVWGAILSRFSPHMSLEQTRQLGRALGERFADIIGGVWFAVAVLLYRYEAWAQQRRRRRKSQKSSQQGKTGKRKVSPTEAIDVEFNRLRGQNGLTRVKYPHSKDKTE